MSEVEERGLTETEADLAIAAIADGRRFTTYRGEEVVLRHLTDAERSVCGRAYNRAYARLIREGELLTKPMAEELVRQRAEASGIGPRALDLDVQRELLKKIRDTAPTVAAQGSEGAPPQELKKIVDIFQGDELTLVLQVQQVNALRAALLDVTVESEAEDVLEREMLLYAVRTPGDAPYFGDRAALDAEPAEFVDGLLREYRTFKRGASRDFLSPSPAAKPGKRAGG